MDHVPFSLVFMSLCVIVIAFSTHHVVRLAATGEAKVNDFMGIRTRHTKASEEAWVAGHQEALPYVQQTFTVAAVAIIAAVIAQVVAGGIAGTAVIGTGFGLQLILLLQSGRVANKAAQKVESTH